MAIHFPSCRFLHHPLQVLALSFTLVNATIARAQNAPDDNDDVVARAWESAHVSLQLKQVPLSQMLWLLGAQSAVRFRYATVPDMEATVELKEALLRPALRDVLATLGFRAQPSVLGRVPFTPPTLWIAREDRPLNRPENRADKTSSQTISAALAPRPQIASPTWQVWTKKAAPDVNWMRPPMPSLGAFSGTVGPNGQTIDGKNSTNAKPAPGVPGLDPVGVSVQWQGTGAREENGWTTLDFTLDETPARPGVQMLFAPNVANQTDGTLRLRWPLELRRVPPRVQLWLETDRPAAFYVNGARMLSWTGARRLDLSNALQSGTNILAIVWNPSDEKERAASAPQLRYEWLAGE